MATLTSTGAVNLTSSTNWSPAQTPVAGDDLVIGAHTLTLDADTVLNTVTFNNVLSKMTVAGSPRVVEATNGWLVLAGVSNGVVTAITTGEITLIGRWTFSNTSSVFRIFDALSAGVVANLWTVASDPSATLILSTSTNLRPHLVYTHNGILNTVGLLDLRTIREYCSLFSTMSAGEWTHVSIGTNRLGDPTLGSPSGIVGSGTGAYFNITGDFIYGGRGAFVTQVWPLAGVRTNIFIGNHRMSAFNSGTLGYPIFSVACTAGGLVLEGGVVDLYDASCVQMSSGFFHWKNQSHSIAADENVLVFVTGGIADLRGLSLTVAGGFLYRNTGITPAVTDADTVVAASSLRVYVKDTGLLPRVLVLPASPPALPDAETVAAGTQYGYEGFEQTGTGLVMDPAIISSAVLAASMATLQRNPAFVIERTLEDERPLNFSWPNSTDTVQGQVSIDNGSYVAVAGVIAYFRSESGKYYYTLSHDAADRPAAEGTARYRFYSMSHSVYATLRVLKASPRVVDIQAGLSLEATSQNILSGVSSLNNNNRGEFF